MQRFIKEKLISFNKWQGLIWAFALTNLRNRYKQRYLRAAWAVINPLVLMLIFTVVFSRVAKLSSEGLPYPIFNFTALIPWMFFASSLGFCVYCLNGQFNLITRVNFPKVTIPLGSILATCFDFAIGLALLMIFFFIYHIKVGFNAFLVIPIILIQIIFTVGVGLIIAIANVYLRDVQSALPIMIQAWMLLSPVGYSLQQVGEKLRFFYLLNPMAGILDSYRMVLLHNQPPNPYYMTMALIISCLTLFIGYAIFKKYEKRMADVICL
jgi:ABC-type polysaccharide/polyol phosphate export permease